MKSFFTYLPVASGILALVLSVGFGISTLGKKPIDGLAIDQNLTTKASESIPSIKLSPAKGNYTFVKGGSYAVGILVDSAEKKIDGVDVVISFDPTKVRISANKVSPSGLLSQFPMNEVSSGKIRFSGLTFEPKAVNGIFGSFKFEPLDKGEITFKIDYAPGNTTDSNIAEQGNMKDPLGEVGNATYVFK